MICRGCAYVKDNCRCKPGEGASPLTDEEIIEIRQFLDKWREWREVALRKGCKS